MRGTQIEQRIQFAGLTSHNNVEMSERAASIAGMDADSPPDVSLATALRSLETAAHANFAWEVPEDVAPYFDVDRFNREAGEAAEAVEAADGGVFVRSNRFQSVVSPDKLETFIQADDDYEWTDPLWHVPTKDYSIVNPLDAYGPLETAIQEEGLDDEVFGEIRTYKGGGEVHMDVLFDNYQIEYTNDENGRDPIVLGIRTGYDFFGGTALYFEGYAQDTRCSNSIRAVTDEKVFRHVGEIDLADEIKDILAELGVMTSQLAELIELAGNIEIELLDMDFAEPFDHNDQMRALYELAGFPSYLATEAAAHARLRADNRFIPNMTNVWDGATYALTHHYAGGENTTRAQELIDRANDFVYNPSLVVGEIQNEHRRRLASASKEASDADGTQAHTASASIEKLSQTTRELEQEFESRNEQLRTMLIASADGETDADTDTSVA